MVTAAWPATLKNRLPMTQFNNAAGIRVRTGFYSGSFDPVTLGHTDVIRRAARLVDRLVIGIGVNPGKSPLFSIDERIAMLEAETAPIALACATRIDIVRFAGLAIHAAASEGATVILRGLRDGTDFDYEMQMAGMNGEMAPDIETVFVAASPNVRHIAANLVRAVATMGGNPSAFVSAHVAQCLAQKAKGGNGVAVRSTGAVGPAAIAGPAPVGGTDVVSASKPPKRHKSPR